MILADGPDIFDQFMPSWTPPTPPVSDSENDVYYDECLDLLYDPDFMGEARLPPTIYDLHRPLTKQPSPVKRSHNTNSLSTEQTVLQLLKSATDPRTSGLFNTSTPYPEENCSNNEFSNIKIDDAFPEIVVPRKSRGGRNDQRSQRDLERAVTPPRPVREEYEYEGPEWNIIEDRALLEAVRNENRLKHLLERNRCPLTYNWEFISGFVNRVTGFYRSPRQCCIRYQTAVRPRENGQLVAIDPLTKKPRKVNLTPLEVIHLRKGRVTTEMQYEFDIASILEKSIQGRIKTISTLASKSLKPFRRSLENVSIDALNGRLPPNHEAKLNEFNLHRISAEDIVLIHEDKHFTSEQRKKAPEKQPAEDRGGSPFRSISVTVRPPAVTAGTGSVVSKAPFVLEVVPLQPVRPPAPPPQSIQSSMQQEHNVVTYTQPALARRVGSISSNYAHNMQQQQTAQQGYVVVGHDSNVPGIRRQEAGGQGVNQVFRSFTGPPARRTPPNTPITTGMTRAPVGYVTSGGQSGGGFTSANPNSSNVYTTCAQTIPAGIQRQAPGRVVPRGTGTRMYMTQGSGTISERGYVMQSNVRMIPNTRLPPRRTTMNNSPNNPQLTTMVMPGRAAPIQQVRAVPRNPANLPPGSRIMVMAPNARSGSQIVQGHTGAPMTRQLLTRGMNVPSRGGSPQTVAQVVIAPPSMQQSQQHSSQPPQLTPSVVVPSSEPSPSPASQNSQTQPSSQSFTPSPQSSQQTTHSQANHQPPQLQMQQNTPSQSSSLPASASSSASDSQESSGHPQHPLS